MDHKELGLEMARRSGVKDRFTERLLVLNTCKKWDLHHSLVLFDRDEPVAGITFTTHRNVAVFHVPLSEIPNTTDMRGMTRLLEM